MFLEILNAKTENFQLSNYNLSIKKKQYLYIHYMNIYADILAIEYDSIGALDESKY